MITSSPLELAFTEMVLGVVGNLFHPMLTLTVDLAVDLVRFGAFS